MTLRTSIVYAHPRVWSTPSVRCSTGTSWLLSASVNAASGAEPLLCHVSSTNGSLRQSPPHFGHFRTTLSIHGLWSSNSLPSGSSFALSTMLRREKAGTFSLQSVHTQIGRGVPQTLSLEMHHGGDCLMNSMNLFLGCSK